VVVPQNIAAAVNYACVECVTHALATQLVVSLPGPLSDDGARELAAIWAELQAFGEEIDGLPLGDLRARLSEFEQRILTVVRADPATQDAGTPAQATPTRSVGGAAATTGSPGVDGDAVPARTGSGAGSAATPTRSAAEPTPGSGAEATGSASETSAPAATTSPAARGTGSAASSSATG
jgi:putative peptide zinc metalloprotease protein